MPGAQLSAEIAWVVCSRALAEYPNETRFLTYAGRAGLRRNRAAAVELLKVAASRSDIYARLLLGQLMLGLDGVSRDTAAGLGLIRSAAEQGSAYAQHVLGWSYLGDPMPFPLLQRLPIPPDRAEAIRWLRRSADQGYAPAQAQLADNLYWHSPREPTDQAEALRLYELAAQQGYALACDQLGRIALLDRRLADYRHWHRMAEELGDADLQLRLAREAEARTPPNLEEAARWYARAATGNNVEALLRLAQFYDEGLGGLQRDQGNAARLYAAAAGQDEPSALLALAHYYEEGLGGVPRDRARATELRRTASAERRPGAR